MSFLISICVLCYVGFVLFLISGLFKHTELDVKSYDTLPKVSVVIAARNEEVHISNLIDDLIVQEYPLDKLEVIIVNDRSTDKTLDILNEANDNYAFIKVISIEESSKEMAPKKNALTKGIESAIGEIIILTDADCRVGNLWVSSMTYSVKYNDCITIGFSEIDENQKSVFELYQKLDFLGIIVANAGAAGWNHYWSGTGQNLAYFKEDYIAINGFQNVKGRVS